MPKDQFRTLSARVPEFVHDKADLLVAQVRPLGHPRVLKEDVVGALVEAATAKSAAKALADYNPKLGQAMSELDQTGP